MTPSWFLVVLSAALFVSFVLLTLACVNCWRRRPLVSIRQTHASEDYTPSTEFRVRVIHPMQPSSDLSSIRSAPHLLSPPRVLSSSDGTQRSHRSFTPTDTGSNPSYENPEDGPDYVNPDPNLPDSDVEDPGYIIVIPGCDALASSNQSRASTPSSDVRRDYVNLGEEEQEEEQEEEPEEPEEPDYLNVDPQLSQKAAAESSGHSDTDDDDEGNYVNQPPMIHSPQSLMGRRLTDRNQ